MKTLVMVISEEDGRFGKGWAEGMVNGSTVVVIGKAVMVLRNWGREVMWWGWRDGCWLVMVSAVAAGFCWGRGLLYGARWLPRFGCHEQRRCWKNMLIAGAGGSVVSVILNWFLVEWINCCRRWFDVFNPQQKLSLKRRRKWGAGIQDGSMESKAEGCGDGIQGGMWT
jgi:hypothetical protein